MHPFTRAAAAMMAGVLRARTVLRHAARALAALAALLLCAAAPLLFPPACSTNPTSTQSAPIQGIVFANKTVFSTYHFPFTCALTWVHTVFTLVGMRLFLAAGMFERKALPPVKIFPLAAAYVAYIVSGLARQRCRGRNCSAGGPVFGCVIHRPCRSHTKTTRRQCQSHQVLCNLSLNLNPVSFYQVCVCVGVTTATGMLADSAKVAGRPAASSTGRGRRQPACNTTTPRCHPRPPALLQPPPQPTNR
jgi:hypothetical protein